MAIPSEARVMVIIFRDVAGKALHLASCVQARRLANQALRRSTTVGVTTTCWASLRPSIRLSSRWLA